jgi:hypothetical protein
MLPSLVPTARIMRYGYDSQWFGKDAIDASVSDVVEQLLKALNRSRDVSQYWRGK